MMRKRTMRNKRKNARERQITLRNYFVRLGNFLAGVAVIAFLIIGGSVDSLTDSIPLTIGAMAILVVLFATVYILTRFAKDPNVSVKSTFELEDIDD